MTAISIPGWELLIQNILNWEVGIAFWAAIVFCVVYSLLAKWWKTSFGRALVLMDLSIAGTLSGSILNREFGVSIQLNEFAAWFTVVCFGVAVFVIVSRIRMVINVNKDKVLRYLSKGIPGKLRLPAVARFLLHL